MNQPIFPGQPSFQPQGYPQGYPQQPQQQGFHPQFTPPGQQQAYQPQAVAAAASGNLFNQFLNEPPRRRANRSKPADGTYVVQFTQNCKLDFSQKDGRPFALLEYRVVEGTVPQMQGQVFTIPVFWSNRLQLQDLADLAKYVFGQQLPAVAQQTQGNPQAMAQFIVQTVAQGYFAGVRVVRSQRQVQQVGYEQAFANHNWIVVTPPNQPINLAQLNVSPAPAMPAMQTPAMPAMQHPPGQAMMPQQPPQGFQPPPAPAAFQPAPMAPQQPMFTQQPAYQQPSMPSPPVPPVYHQPAAPAPALPQAPPPTAPPAFVPGGLPQR